MTHKPLERDEVQLNIEAADWEDAIRKSARPLVGRHKVTQAYVDEIVRVTREEGPYFIIMKHVALPHAKPEYGALENGVSLTTLKDPLCFGHKNDPVKYIIFLSSADGEEHLHNISRIAELLGRKEFLEVLDQAEDSSMVCDFFNQ